MSQEKIICACLNITEKQIVNAVENGLTTVKKIGQKIEAGTICRNCTDEIQAIIDKVKPQQEDITNNTEDRVVCGCLNITEKEIINAVENGATTLKEVEKTTKATTICGACKESVQEVIDKAKPKEKIVCGCYKITEEEIVKAIKNGATTVDSIGNITRAGTGCGKCKEKIQEIIDNTDKVICGCLNITEKEIINVVENGATTLREVEKATKATTICGACKESVQEVIDKTKPQENTTAELHKEIDDETINKIEPKHEDTKLEYKKTEGNEIKKINEKEKNKSFLGKVKNIFK